MQAPDPYRAGSRKTLWWLLGGGVLLVGLLAFGLGANLLGLMGQRPGSATGLGGERPAPATSLPGAAPPPTTQLAAEPAPPITPQAAKRMPQDILDWLRHLERCENERKRISHEQIGVISASLAKMSLGGAEKMLGEILSGEEGDPEATPSRDVATSIPQHKEAWDGLLAFFQSVPPPSSCINIAQNFSQALGGTRQMMLEVLTAVEQSEQSPEKAISALSAMRGTSSERIDAAAKRADQGVAEVCAYYDTPKWFSLSSDFGGGMAGNMPSLPMN